MDNIAYIVYDGDCPFCSRYTKMLRLRAALGQVEIVDARSDHPVVTLLQERHVNLDEGMAFVQNGQIVVGDECIHKIALLTTPSGVFNRVNAFVFRSATASRVLYPVLRFGRNAALKLLGRRKIAD